MQKNSSNYMFCKGTKIYSIQKVSNEKSEFFRLRNFFLNRKRTKIKLHLLVIFFFFFFAFQTRPCNLGAHQHGIKLRHECKIYWVPHEMLIPCMRFRESLKTNLKAGNSRSLLVNVLVQQWQPFSSSTKQHQRLNRGAIEATVTMHI